jgi:4-carboxymuconolactone decarboxylase
MTQRYPWPRPLSAEQDEAAAMLINGPRRGVYGPFAILVESPEVVAPISALGEYFRYSWDLEARVREALILVTAHYWASRFEWDHHYPLALAQGVARDDIERISVGEAPSDPDLRLAWSMVTQLLTEGGLSDIAYRDLQNRWSSKQVVEMVSCVGYYSLLAVVLRADNPPSPGPSSEPRDSPCT